MTGPNILDQFRTNTGSPYTGGGKSILDQFRVTPNASDIRPKNNEPGFFSRLNNVITNLNELNPGTWLADKLLDPIMGQRKDRVDILQNVVRANSGDNVSQSLSMAGDKLSHIGDFVKQDVVGALGKGIGNILDDPTGVATSLPSGLLSMATQPLAAVLGVEIDKNNPQPLDPTDRANTIKDTAALLAQMAITAGSSKALGTLGKTASIASTDAELAFQAANKLSKTGAFINEFTKGVVEGGVGGFTYGAISGSGEPDQLDKAVASGMLFAPLGGVIQALSSTNKAYKFAADNKETAEVIQNWKQLNYKYSDSLKDLDTKATSIINSDDLANAVLKSKIELNPNQPAIVSGASLDKLATLPKDLQYDIHIRPIEKGKGDILVVPKGLDINTDIFKRSGYVENELVSYNGKDYTIKSVHNKSIEDISPREAYIIPKAGGAGELVSINSIRRLEGEVVRQVDPEEVLDQQYNQFKQNLLASQKVTKIADIVPELSNFDKVYQELPLDKQIVFNQRLHSELLNELPEADRNIYDQHIANYAKRQVSTLKEFQDYALTNGYKVDIEDAGKVTIRDYGDPNRRLVGSGMTLNEAKSYIDKTGQSQAIDLVAGNVSGLVGKSMNNMGEAPSPFRPPPILGIMQELLSKSTTIVPWLSQYADTFREWDKQLGTRFYTQYDNTQVAKTTSKAQGQVIKDKLKKINDILPSNITKDRLELISQWLETASPETRIKALELSPEGVEFAKQLNSNSSIQNAFKYISEKRKIENDANLKPQDKLSKISNLSKLLALSTEDQAHLDIINHIFDNYNKKTLSVGDVIQVARDINNKSIDRVEFASKNNMSSKEVAAASSIEKIYNELKSTFKIKDPLPYYMTHARLYTDGDMRTAMNLFAREDNPAAQEFSANLTRTGELDAYETNPFKAMNRYINSGFDALHYNKAEQGFKQYLQDQLNNNPNLPDAQKAKMQQVAEQYLNDVRGTPPIQSRATNQAVNSWLDKWIPGTNTNAKDIISWITQLPYMATQGFRPLAGMRDFMNSSNRAYTWFGSSRAANMINLGMQEIRSGSKLIQSGELPGLDFQSFSDPSGNPNIDMIKSAWDKVGGIGMQMSGQQLAYNSWRMGAYKDAFELSAKAGRDLAGGKIDRAGYIKQLELDKHYSPAVVEEVNRQLDMSPIRYDDIARFMGRETARLVTPTYGTGNTAYGWTRNVGRLAGQYGNFSTWALGNFKQGISNGTLGSRFARATRFGLGVAAIYELGKSLDADLSPWYIHSNMGFGVGPMLETGHDIYQAIFAGGYEGNQAMDNLSKLLPYQDGEFRKQIYIPFSFAADDIMKGNTNPLNLIMKPAAANPGLTDKVFDSISGQ